MSTTTNRRPLVAAVVLIPLLIGLALAAFAWPAARTAPRDLPVGVTGPGAAAVEQKLGDHPGAFDPHRYDDEADARAAIRDREVYGAVVTGPAGVTVLTASAASPVVAQMLGQAFGPSATVVDVVPADPDDPRGAALGASLFPLVLAGVLIGVVVSLIGSRPAEQAGALVVAATLTGLVAVGVAQGWLGVLGGNWLVNGGVLAMTVLAISATVAGLGALLGRPGLPLGALLMVFVGNPFSGVATAPELLPDAARAIGQALPPGAGGTLLRSASFFDGAAATWPLLVLSVWTVLGLAAVGIAARRSPSRATALAPATA